MFGVPEKTASRKRSPSKRGFCSVKYAAKSIARTSTTSYSPIGACCFSARRLPKIFAKAWKCFFVMVLLWFVLVLRSRIFLAILETDENVLVDFESLSENLEAELLPIRFGDFTSAESVELVDVFGVIRFDHVYRIPQPRKNARDFFVFYFFIFLFFA